MLGCLDSLIVGVDIPLSCSPRACHCSGRERFIFRHTLSYLKDTFKVTVTKHFPTVVAGARHSFENSDLPPTSVQPRGLNWTRCRFIECTAGEIVNSESNRAFGLNDPCFSRGPTVGYSQAAHAQALKAVQKFFTA